jgi:hypothetical protein
VNDPLLFRFENDLKSTRSIDKIDMAAVLVALKTRHCLSASCIDDICSLLSLLKVPNAPCSWFHVKTALDRSSISPLVRKCWSICPRCGVVGEDPIACNSTGCDWVLTPPEPIPISFFTFDIIQQLSSILATTNHLRFPKRTNLISHSIPPMRDIVDGAHYRDVLDRESGQFLTLTMSTDGVQPYNNSDKGIWPVTFVINEINRQRRFCFENLIIGGVWPGPKKPKREEMFAFLDMNVKQLRELENGCYFVCRSGAGLRRRFLKVFLICSCMDKPAQALVQNLAEPTAKYGCGRCELRGEGCLFSAIDSQETDDV